MTDLMPAKYYVQTCFPTAEAHAGEGYFCIQAITSAGVIWLGSAGVESQAWDTAARDLNTNGGWAGYAVPSWGFVSEHLKGALS